MLDEALVVGDLAMRCLKRRLSDVIYRQLIADLTTTHNPPLIE